MQRRHKGLLKISVIDDNFLGAAPLEIIKLSSKGVDKGWFEKRGSILSSKIANLEPIEGKTPVYMLPMGAGEFYSSNRNADFWPETKCTKVANDGSVFEITEGLMERHPTFVTHANVYKDHANDDPEKRSGEILVSDYHPDMHRVEVVAFVDNDKWDKELEKIATHGATEVSMAATVPWDRCSVCSNKASNPEDYCNHIKFYKNAILDDGCHVCMVNEKPTFIDISSVNVNADRLGYGLGILDLGGSSKEASEDNTDVFKESKLAVLQKLNDIEKEISCPATSVSIEDKVKAVGSDVSGPLDGHSILIIRNSGPSEVASSLSSKGGILSPSDFIETFFGDMPSVDEIKDEVFGCLPNVFEGMCDKVRSKGFGDVFGESMLDTDMGVKDDKVEAIVDAIKPVLSVLPEDADIRITVSTEKVPQDKGKMIVTKKSKETSDTFEKLAEKYGAYVVEALCRMEREGLKPDYFLPVVRNRMV